MSELGPTTEVESTFAVTVPRVAGTSKCDRVMKLGPTAEVEGALRATVPRVVGTSKCVRILSSEGVSAQGHMMVSPAVGQKRREKEPLKQCLKKTWRQAQKTRRCFSFRAPKTRSAGVESGGI